MQLLSIKMRALIITGLCFLLIICQAFAISRLKRQSPSLWQCPSNSASTRSSRNVAYLAFYSPKTRQDQNVYQARTNWNANEVDKVIASGAFDLNKTTLIYTHGYTQTINRPWLKSIRRDFDEMLSKGNAEFNLVLFDWSDYGQLPYGTSASYVGYLGKLLAELIDDHLTKRHNYRANKIHIIGYSLSTHIAGQAGKKLKAKGNPLSQITAIDPTGVCFHRDSSNKFAERFQLRPNDAGLVVARHYDMGGLGAKRPIGGMDIFVNGGSNQPSMSLRGKFSMFGLMSGLGGSSSHMRASQHEAEPFDPACHEIAYACDSYQRFLDGACASCGPNNQKCFHIRTLGRIQLGQKMPKVDSKIGNKMYITTGREQFCLHNYQVIAKLSNEAKKSDIRQFESGSVSAAIAPSDRGQVIVNPRHKIPNKNQFTQLLQLNDKVAQFEDQIEMKGLKNVDSLQSLEINYMSNVNSKERKRNSMRYCPDNGSDILVQC